MGPQSGSCGYPPGNGRPGVDVGASMGPQSGSCGYFFGGGSWDRGRYPASMGPQSGSCGYDWLTERLNRLPERFNGSTVW